MRETIRTNDAELYLGWPTTDQDEQQLTVGIVYHPTIGDPVSAWATLDSPEQVATARRAMQRGSRKVWPDAPAPLLAPDLVLPSSVFGPVATGLVTPADDA